MDGTRHTLRMLFLVLVLLGPTVARAGHDTWSAPANGYFHIDGNWTDGSAPTAADTVEFGVNTTPYEVWWDATTGSRTTESLSLTDGDVTFRVENTSGPYTWTITNGTSDADATITAGTLTLGLAGYDGVLSLAIDDTLTVDDGGTLNVTLANAAQAQTTTVGSTGTGTLTIASGAGVSDAYASVGDASTATGTATVDGGTWANTGPLYVGREGAGTLTVSGGGSVTGTEGHVARYGTATGTVTVTGEASAWQSSEGLFLGGTDTEDGGAATVAVDSGGRLYAGDIDPATVSLSSTMSAVVVSDSDASGGNLVVRHGAALSNDGMAYLGDNTGETGTATVTGTGSSWTNARDMTVGYWGEGTLAITGGGSVSSASGMLGYWSGSSGTATVTGAGSRWDNSGHLYVGFNGTGTLTLSGGGEAMVGADTWVSRQSGSSGTIHFDNGTLTTAGLACAFGDLTGTGTIDAHGLLSDVDLVFDATHGLSQTFTIDANPGQNITLNLDVDGSGVLGAGYGGCGTTSIADGLNVESSNGYIGYRPGSTGAVTIEGTGSTWTNQHDLVVGFAGTGTLDVTGGSVVTDDLWIGEAVSASGTVRVSGSGSTLTTDDALTVGQEGTGRLEVTGGACVDTQSLYVAEFPGSSGTVMVDGPGSTCRYEYLELGEGDASLTVSGGARFTGYGGGTVLGDRAYGSGTLLVDGAGSAWDRRDNLTVGREGTGRLDVTGGACVDTQSLYVAEFPGSWGAVLVDGAGSTCRYEYLELGEGDASLTVSGGGRFGPSPSGGGGGYVTLGQYSGSRHTVRIDGPGSAWEGVDELTLGERGYASLTVSGGARFTGDGSETVLGDWAYGSGTLLVDGAGSAWDRPQDDLTVGREGTGRLDVTGGASADTNTLYVARYPGSWGAVLVDGAGSTCRYEYLELGEGDASLTVSGGGRFGPSPSGGGSGDVTLGQYSGSRHTVRVDGAASAWEGVAGLVLGEEGHASLTVSGGARFTGDGSGQTVLGDWAYGSGTLLVDGAGSAWDRPQDDLTVGREGAGRLEVTGGASVASRVGVIGYAPQAVGGATFSGAGTTWSVSDDLTIGLNGHGSLAVTSGATVTVGDSPTDTTTMAQGASSGADVVVTGYGSLLRTEGSMTVGQSGRATLTVSDGGRVTAANDLLVGSPNAPAGLTVVGAGSMCDVAGDLAVGGDVPASLTISDGARVSVLNDLYIGRGWVPLWGEGSIRVDGMGTRLDVGGRLNSRGATAASLWVTDGAAVYVDLFYGLADNVTLTDGVLQFRSDSGGSSDGDVRLAGTARLRTPGMSNCGRLTGNGSVDGDVSNQSGGVIEAIGGTLVFGDVVSNAAGGLITATTGNTLLFNGGVTTNKGLISLAGGTVETDPEATLTNNGDLMGYGVVRTGGLGNYQRVVLSGGTTMVNGPVTNLPTGNIEVLYHPAVFTDHVTNDGHTKVTDTTVTFAGGFTNNGTYTSDPSDNLFTSVDVGKAGAFVGGAGDRFLASGDFLSKSTNAAAWNTAEADLIFHGAADPHIMTVTGATGGGWTDNFAWGGLTVRAGQAVALADDATPGGTLYASALTLEADAEMNTAGLTVVTRTLSNAGTLDLTTGNLVVDYEPGSSPYADIEGWVTDGYNGGAWNSGGTAVGITTANGNDIDYALAIVDTNDPDAGGGFLPADLEGEPFDDTSVLVKYTFYADANLDGVLTSTDITRLVTAFSNGLVDNTPRWIAADFNYDDALTSTDITLLVTAFSNHAGQSLSGGDPMPLGGGMPATTPEPATLALLALGGLGVLLNRRRRA